MFGLTSKQRTALYAVGNGFLAMLVAVLGAHADAPTGQVIYLVLMLAVCTAPILLMESLNGTYVLLGLFLALYFVFFAALELLSLFGGETGSLDGGFMSATEAGLVLGAVCAFVGYLLGAKLGTPRDSAAPPKDWTRGMILWVGLALWLSGAAAILYLQVWVVPVKTNEATNRGMAAIGQAMQFLIMIGQLAEPLGILILSYAYARFRSLPWFVLIVAVVVIQVVIGFICDMKSLGMLGGILVILAKVFMDNKLPKGWLLAGVVFIVVVFPLFQLYRAEVTGERGMTRTQAFENIDKVLDIVLARSQEDSDGSSKQRTATFLERSALKGNVELAVEHTGVDTPFQEGRTMVALWTAFIPRLIWPDKPDVAVGQEFNHTFIHGEFDTFISPSNLGELYWNYGWSGVVFGMLIIGALLGFVGAKCNMARSKSLARLLILLATAKYACLGFEGSIAIAYVQWMRSIAAIGILHLIFARRRTEAMASAEVTAPGSAAAPALATPSGLAAAPAIANAAPASAGGQLSFPGGAAHVPRFPNLMS